MRKFTRLIITFLGIFFFSIANERDESISWTHKNFKLQKIGITNYSLIRNREILFRKRGLPRIKVILNRGKKYIPAIRKIFKEHGIPEDLAFLPIIESHFNIHAKSPAGARGLWQFMPHTARTYGLRINKWVDERLDPEKSTIAAALYLKDLHSIFEDWGLALASYNAGEGAIIRKINRYRATNFWDIDEYLSRETRNYVPNFIATLIIVKDLLKKENFNYDYISYDVVKLNKPVSLKYISRHTGIPYKKLKEMNPHLKRSVIPPDNQEYNLYVPKGMKNAVLYVVENAPLKKYPALINYEVQKGDTLSKIAQKFHTSVRRLKKLNHLKSSYINSKMIITVPSYILAPPDYYRGLIDLTDELIYTQKGFYYRVKRGDTLRKISRKFGVSITVIKLWNKLKGNIYPNMKLFIPVKKRDVKQVKKLIKVKMDG